MFVTRVMVAALLIASPALTQTPTDPLPSPIAAVDGVIKVNFVEFASLPDIDGQAARMNLLVDEPATRRMFVNDMRGPLYSVSYEGKTVTQYLDICCHNPGRLGFNPFASPGSADFGLLYLSVADGGSGRLAQNLSSAFGKILRIDPLGTNSANGNYGIPAANPFVNDGNASTLGEVYAYGMRNPQRFEWDPRDGNMFVADIGQSIVEEVSPVTAGANLGWNDWEGSFRFISRTEVRLTNQRGDPKVTYPVVEYGHVDPLLQRANAVTGVIVYRSNTIPRLANLLLFGDNPSGEVFYINADTLPSGGQDAIRRILFSDKGVSKTLLELIQEKNVAQGKPPATRADLRFGMGPDNQVLVLNKHDGTIRLLVR